MKKIFTFIAAALLSAGMYAEPLHVYVSAMPTGTPEEGVDVFGSFGAAALSYLQMAWQIDVEEVEDLPVATADDTFGFRCTIEGAKKVLAKQVEEKWVPIELRVGDYWEDWALVPGVKAIALYDNDPKKWDAANYKWIDAPITPGYYLVGSMTDWKADEAYLFAKNPEAEGEYMLDVTLKEGDQIKVMYADSEKTTWYPDGMDNHYTVDAAHAGDVTVYFRPDGQGGSDWHHGFFYVTEPSQEGISNTAVAPKAMKRIVDGQLLIERDGKTYTTLGQTL